MYLPLAGEKLLENCGSSGIKILSILVLLTTYNCNLPLPLFHFIGSITEALLVLPVGDDSVISIMVLEIPAVAITL